jgi:hypothetical protein
VHQVFTQHGFCNLQPAAQVSEAALYSIQYYLVSQDSMVAGPCQAFQDFCYANLFHGGIAMTNSDLLPSLLFKINQNQLAL